MQQTPVKLPDSHLDLPTGAFYQTLRQWYRGYTTDVKDKAVRVVFTIRPTGFKAR